MNEKNADLLVRFILLDFEAGSTSKRQCMVECLRSNSWCAAGYGSEVAENTTQLKPIYGLRARARDIIPVEAIMVLERQL